MASPACLIQVNAGGYNPTSGGTNTPSSAAIDFKLNDPVGVTQWTVRVIGSDELTAPPVLVGAHPVTGVVPLPTDTVSFVMPAGVGRTVVVESLIQVGVVFSTDRFAVYILSAFAKRIPAAGERVEGSAYYGWATHLNPLLREGAAKVYYDDTVVPVPSLGSNHAQGAIDALKLLVGTGSGGKAPLERTLFGVYDGAVTPGFVDAPQRVTTAGTLVKASVFRRYAGTAGTTRVDVWLNGVSLFGLPPTMPQVTAGMGDYAYNAKVLSVPVVSGDRIEFLLVETESYSAGPTPQEDGPEGLSMIVEMT